MKRLCSIIAILFALQAYGQSSAEKEILQLSNQIFTWEVENKIDSLTELFDEKFVVINGSGESKFKNEYLRTLRSGSFVHNSIDVAENKAAVSNNTATVVGKGRFTVTISGTQKILQLSYVEVFIRARPADSWKILAMHATAQQH